MSKSGDAWFIFIMFILMIICSSFCGYTLMRLSWSGINYFEAATKSIKNTECFEVYKKDKK